MSPYAESPDFAGLLERVKRRDAQAEEDLYSVAFHVSIGFLRGRLRNFQDADYVARGVARAVLLAAQGTRGIADPGALKSFILTVAFRQKAAYLREEVYGAQTVSIDDKLCPRATRALCSTDTPEGFLLASEQKMTRTDVVELARVLTTRVPAGEREILIRCYWEGQERERIAREMGLSEKAVSQGKWRGTKLLVSLVQKELRQKQKWAPAI